MTDLDAKIRKFQSAYGLGFGDDDSRSTLEGFDREIEVFEPDHETPEAAWKHRQACCFVPPVYAKVPESLPIPSALANWNESSWSLSLLGPTGCGKTWLAVRILLGMASLNRRGRFADASLAVEQIKREFGTDRQGETFNTLCSVPVLLLDDLGAERGTDFQVEQIGLILRARYNSVLATIITTNAERIDDIVEPRIASRLASGVFPVKGRDRRLLQVAS